MEVSAEKSLPARFLIGKIVKMKIDTYLENVRVEMFEPQTFAKRWLQVETEFSKLTYNLQVN